MHIIDIFPTAIYVSHLNVTDVEREYVFSHKDKAYPNQFGNSTSLNTYILSDGFLKNLKEQIDVHLKTFNTSLGYDSQLKVTQSWINYNPTNSSHHTHNHYNSIISGVMYLSDNPSELVFQRDDYKTIVPNILKDTKYSSNSYRFKPQKDMLVLFPSNLKHGVDKNSSTETRISLAFNTFYIGIIGDDSALTQLELS